VSPPGVVESSIVNRQSSIVNRQSSILVSAMQLARVIGDVIVTRKDDSLTGRTLLVLQPIGADGRAAGRTLVAVDAVGAGVGETVFFVRGKEASFPFSPDEVPVDAGIVGIVDAVDTVDD
jgi:microcompartment protein CcmK/EutM